MRLLNNSNDYSKYSKIGMLFDKFGNMRVFLLILFTISVQITLSQDFTKVDSIVKNYPKEFKSIERLANRINSDFETDLEKTRATNLLLDI